MADLVLKVSTEEVRQKAAQIETQKAAMEGIMNDLQSKITLLGTYFKSDAGSNYAAQYTTVSKNIQQSLNALMKHTSNLKEMADKLDNDNNDVTKKASNLSTEQIF